MARARPTRLGRGRSPRKDRSRHSGRPWAHAGAGPASPEACERALLTDLGLIPGPDLQRLGPRRFGRRPAHQFGRFHMAAAPARRSAGGAAARRAGQTLAAAGWCPPCARPRARRSGAREPGTDRSVAGARRRPLSGPSRRAWPGRPSALRRALARGSAGADRRDAPRPPALVRWTRSCEPLTAHPAALRRLRPAPPQEHRGQDGPPTHRLGVLRPTRRTARLRRRPLPPRGLHRPAGPPFQPALNQPSGPSEGPSEVNALCR